MKRCYSGTAVWLEPVKANSITSCQNVGRGPARSLAAAHWRPTLGSRRRLRGDPHGGDLERSCHGVGRVDSLRQSMRGYWGGSWAGQGTAVQQKNGGPAGLSPHWASGSCDDPAGAPVPWLSQVMVLRRHPCRGAASLSKLLFPGRER